MASPVMQLTATPEPTAAARWHPLTRVAFRFACCYFGLYSLIVLSNAEDWLPYEKLWRTIVPWVGKHILHLSNPVTYFVSGSGDKTSDWVLLLCQLVISVAATIVWSVFDRRQEYAALNKWLRVLLRYSVAWTMVAYGSVKVVKLQFPDPYLERYFEPLGAFSPMGLLWTFMGASTAYTFFAGACELLGGVLLFFRRTTTLGALVTAAVMINVAMLNFAYDVPVKLLSAHLILMCGYLLLPDMGCLFNFFIRNRAAAPAPVQPHFAGRRLRVAAGIAKLLLLGYLLIGSVLSVRQGRAEYGSGAPKSPLYGIWEVEEFARDGEVLPPLVTDKTRWRRFVTERPNGVSVTGMDDSPHPFPVRFDIPKAAIISTANPPRLMLTWSRPDADHLILTGTADGRQVVARLKRMDETKMNLLGRGFHWISERPFNH